MTTADGSDDRGDASTASERSEAGSEGGLSRRDALRRFGIAAGVAWTAPVVMSLYSPAGAQTVGTPGPNTSTTAPPDLECVGTTCGAFEVCSHGLPDDESDDCVCVTTADGLGLCTPGSLTCVGLEECGPGNSCPPGTTCALDTCCGTPVCIPLTVAGACPPDPPTARAGARTWVANREPSAAEFQRGAASTNSSAASMHANSRDDWK